MQIDCIWEHNGSDTLLYALAPVGAFTRGPDLKTALDKMPGEIRAYCRWLGEKPPEELTFRIVQEKCSELDIRDADSDVLFDTEQRPLTAQEYDHLKALALKSAEDFLALYEHIPDKTVTPLPPRRSFYGAVPRTAEEMYRHTKSVNSYYFGELGLEADNEGTILDCRRSGFEALEQRGRHLENPLLEGSYGENWTLRKVLRRFLWHDRIHARAMYRMAVQQFGREHIPNVFCFERI